MNPWDDQDRFVMTAPKPGIFLSVKALVLWIIKFALLTAVMTFFVCLVIYGPGLLNSCVNQLWPLK